MTPTGCRAPTLMNTPLFTHSSAGAAVSIWVVVRNVYSLASTSLPRERRDRDTQPVGEGQGSEQIVELGLGIGAVEADGGRSFADDRTRPEADEMAVFRELGRGGRLGAVALIHLRASRARGNLDLER